MYQAAWQMSSSGGQWSLAWDCSGAPRNYNYKRYYQPGTGRYLSVDPVRDSLDYSYGRNNPQQLVDPTGEVVPLVVGGAIIGGAVNAAMYLATHQGESYNSREFLGQVASGILAGAIGGAAGPLGGTIAKSLGQLAKGPLAKIMTGFISGIGGVGGEALNRTIQTGKLCVENFQMTGNEYLWASLGGLAAASFSIKGVATLNQAKYFSPKSVEAFLRTANSRTLLTTYGVSAAAAAAGPKSVDVISKLFDDSRKSIMDGYTSASQDYPGQDFVVPDSELYAIPK